MKGSNSFYWMTIALYLLVGSCRRVTVAFRPSSLIQRRTITTTTTKRSMTKISISDAFDGGNGRLVQIMDNDNDKDVASKTVQGEIKKDP